MVDIQSMATEIRQGKKKKDRKKPQGKNIMVCPITYGDHNYQYSQQDVQTVRRQHNLIRISLLKHTATPHKTKHRTSGYAMVVHGRLKTPKKYKFFGVTQPLYSRGHNYTRTCNMCPSLIQIRLKTAEKQTDKPTLRKQWSLGRESIENYYNLQKSTRHFLNSQVYECSTMGMCSFHQLTGFQMAIME